MRRSIVVYTRPGCLFCQQVESMLDEARLPFRSEMVGEAGQQLELISRCGARSFPLVFVDEVYVGSFTHIVHLHSQGRLVELIKNDPKAGSKGAAQRAASAANKQSAAKSSLGTGSLGTKSVGTPSLGIASTRTATSDGTASVGDGTAPKRTGAVAAVQSARDEVAGWAAWGKHRREKAK